MFALITAISMLIFCLSIALVVVVLRPRPESDDVMHQAVGDAPRFQRHVRSVEEEV